MKTKGNTILITGGNAGIGSQLFQYTSKYTAILAKVFCNGGNVTNV